MPAHVSVVPPLHLHDLPFQQNLCVYPRDAIHSNRGGHVNDSRPIPPPMPLPPMAGVSARSQSMFSSHHHQGPIVDLLGLSPPQAPRAHTRSNSRSAGSSLEVSVSTAISSPMSSPLTPHLEHAGSPFRGIAVVVPAPEVPWAFQGATGRSRYNTRRPPPLQRVSHSQPAPTRRFTSSPCALQRLPTILHFPPTASSVQVVSELREMSKELAHIARHVDNKHSARTMADSNTSLAPSSSRVGAGEQGIAQLRGELAELRATREAYEEAYTAEKDQLQRCISSLRQATEHVARQTGAALAAVQEHQERNIAPGVTHRVQRLGHGLVSVGRVHHAEEGRRSRAVVPVLPLQMRRAVWAHSAPTIQNHISSKAVYTHAEDVVKDSARVVQNFEGGVVPLLAPPFSLGDACGSDSGAGIMASPNHNHIEKQIQMVAGARAGGGGVRHNRAVTRSRSMTPIAFVAAMPNKPESLDDSITYDPVVLPPPLCAFDVASRVGSSLPGTPASDIGIANLDVMDMIGHARPRVNSAIATGGTTWRSSSPSISATQLIGRPPLPPAQPRNLPYDRDQKGGDGAASQTLTKAMNPSFGESVKGPDSAHPSRGVVAKSSHVPVASGTRMVSARPTSDGRFQLTSANEGNLAPRGTHAPWGVWETVSVKYVNLRTREVYTEDEWERKRQELLSVPERLKVSNATPAASFERRDVTASESRASPMFSVTPTSSTPTPMAMTTTPQRQMGQWGSGTPSEIDSRVGGTSSVSVSDGSRGVQRVAPRHAVGISGAEDSLLKARRTVARDSARARQVAPASHRPREERRGGSKKSETPKIKK